MLNDERGARRLTRRKRTSVLYDDGALSRLVFAAGRRILSGDGQSGVLTTTDTMDEYSRLRRRLMMRSQKHFSRRWSIHR